MVEDQKEDYQGLEFGHDAHDIAETQRVGQLRGLATTRAQQAEVLGRAGGPAPENLHQKPRENNDEDRNEPPPQNENPRKILESKPPTQNDPLPKRKNRRIKTCQAPREDVVVPGSEIEAPKKADKDEEVPREDVVPGAEIMGDEVAKKAHKDRVLLDAPSPEIMEDDPKKTDEDKVGRGPRRPDKHRIDSLIDTQHDHVVKLAGEHAYQEAINDGKDKDQAEKAKAEAQQEAREQSEHNVNTTAQRLAEDHVRGRGGANPEYIEDPGFFLWIGWEGTKGRDKGGESPGEKPYVWLRAVFSSTPHSLY